MPKLPKTNISLRCAVAAGLLACASLAATPASAASTLVFCSEGSPEGFNPQYFTTGTTFDAVSVPMFNRLVEFEIGTTNVIPALAQSWEISPDAMTYTFKLRKGAKFHGNGNFKPSRDLNADDVLFSFRRQMDPNHPFHKISPGQTYSYWDDMAMSKIVDSVEKIDDLTVRFKLKRPEAPFLANLAMDFASILSAEYFEEMKRKGTLGETDQSPIGTGPFQFVSYQKDAIIRYKAFDQYWGGRPKIDNLVFSITKDATARYAKLKTGECHVMAYPKPADIEQMKKDPQLTVQSKEGLNIGYIAFNVEKKPFDNKLVRQALNMATNKDAILKAVFQGNGQAATNPIPPILWSYNKKIKDYAYDPAKAKELLAKAGFPDGFEMDLWYLPVTRPYNPDGKRMAELMQADWDKIGVKAKLVTFEWAEYRKRSKVGEQQAIMFGWSGDNGDPDNFFMPLLGCEAVKGGGNAARWCNKEFNDLITKAAQTAKQADRAKLYEEAQVIVKEEAPWITIAHSLRFTPVRKEVQNFKMDATAHHYFTRVELTK